MRTPSWEKEPKEPSSFLGRSSFEQESGISWTTRVLIGTLIGLTAILILIIVFSSTPEKASQSYKTTKPYRGHTSGVGDEVRLDHGGGDVLVAINKQAYKELVEAVAAKDKVGYNLMVAKGYAFFVPRGTRAKVIDMTIASRKVRIYEGEHYGRTGWIPYEWARPSR
jgi:hypothetical protein